MLSFDLELDVATESDAVAVDLPGELVSAVADVVNDIVLICSYDIAPANTNSRATYFQLRRKRHELDFFHGNLKCLQ